MSRLGWVLIGTAVMASGALPLGAQGGRAAGADTSDGALIPAGYGTLRQDDIAIALKLDGVLVKLIPLDESVIRVLAPDSYKSLHDLRQNRAGQMARRGAFSDLHEQNAWWVEFNALIPDIAFTPTDLTISAPGRDFHPVQVIELTKGFGQNRLQVRQPQRAIYLFDDGLDVNQPLTATMGAVTSADWQSILRRVETERTQVRARAAKAGRGAPPI